AAHGEGDFLRDVRAARKRLASTEGYRLARGTAVRLRRVTRGDGRPHTAFTDGHRREPRPVRDVAVPRTAHNRFVPDDDVRRRTALPPRRRTDARRDRITADGLLRRLPPRPVRRDRPTAEAAPARRRVRLPLDPLRYPAAVRRRAAALQHRNRFRKVVRSAA